MSKGSIYLENHNRGGKYQSRFHIWCAEIFVDGKRLRKRSMDRNECVKWLRGINKTLCLLALTIFMSACNKMDRDLPEHHQLDVVDGIFTVNQDGKKVKFAKGNLYWDGSEFHFEEHQYDYPTEWDANHVGHFYWDMSKGIAVGLSYINLHNNSVYDTFFAANGRAITGWTVLSRDEWDYVYANHIAKNSSLKNTIIIAEKECIILKPDGFNGPISDSYTAEEWVKAEEKYGLIALPFAGDRRDKHIYSSGFDNSYWSSSPGPSNTREGGHAFFMHFNSNDIYTDLTTRNKGFSVRLVKVQ